MRTSNLPMPASVEIMEPMKFLNQGVIHYIRCYGDAMNPHYKPGDMLAVRPVSINNIEYGYAYFISTKPDYNDMKLIRYAIEHPTDDSKIILRSAQPHLYEDLEWSKSILKSVDKVIGILRIEEN